LVSPAEAAGGLGLADTNDIDGYVAVGDVKGLLSRQGLIRDEDGRVTLRATSMDIDVVRDLSSDDPTSRCALDGLAEVARHRGLAL
jgi:hypothetical protein